MHPRNTFGIEEFGYLNNAGSTLLCRLPLPFSFSTPTSFATDWTPLEIFHTMYTQHLPTGEAIIPNIINNAAVALSDKHKFPIIQGTTGSIIHYAQSATVDIGVQAVESAAEAFKIWRKTPISTRQAILNKVAEILPGKIEELAKREIPETSCDPHWPTFECTYASKFVNTTATNLGSVMGSIPPAEVDGSLSLVFKEPVGVVLCIIPYVPPPLSHFPRRRNRNPDLTSNPSFPHIPSP